ncbi:MAG: putative toxin-antitoxin system toxin component, PIN family [Microgenomates group bacterium Gr01-1014_7]|nr:MAG: putative toxin-antitoxin system toxin component, PIN family [Microgenomates group bacterium Gr01-1014_7]
MRVVLDTNIYIAAALKGGFSEEIIKILAKTISLTTVISEEILTELVDKLTNKFNRPQEDINNYVSRIRKFIEIVEITEKISVIIRDPKDNKILECAVSGQADLIVSLDQDLIKLKTFRGIGIIHPKTLSWTFPEYFKKN